MICAISDCQRDAFPVFRVSCAVFWFYRHRHLILLVDLPETHGAKHLPLLHSQCLLNILSRLGCRWTGFCRSPSDDQSLKAALALLESSRLETRRSWPHSVAIAWTPLFRLSLVETCLLRTVAGGARREVPPPPIATTLRLVQRIVLLRFLQVPGCRIPLSRSYIRSGRRRIIKTLSQQNASAVVAEMLLIVFRIAADEFPLLTA